MSFFEIDVTPPPEPKRPPRQFTLSGLLRLFVVIGIICATATWFDNLGVAFALAVATCVFYFLPWARLPENRLPQNRGDRYTVLASAVFVVWVLMDVFPVLLPPALMLPVALFLARGRFGYLAIFLLLSPLGVLFGNGVWHYWQGTAVLWTVGEPSSHPELDRRTRCYWQTSGCGLRGNEWAHHGPNNAGVRVMTSLFGFMRGTYTGPFPSESEAVAALKAAITVPWEQLLQGRVELLGQTIHLDEDARWSIEREHKAETANGGVAPKVTAVLWKEECLLIRVRGAECNMKLKDYCPVHIFLILRSTGQPLATYYDEEIVAR